VQVPEVTVTAPAQGEAAPRPAKPVTAPAAAQQSSTPRSVPKAAAVEPSKPKTVPQQAAAPAVAAPVQVDPSAVTVAPTGSSEPVEKIASSVTVITATEIEAQQRRTAPDLLRSVPGVNVVQQGNSGGLTSVFIRGTNSNHVKVLIDGIDVSDPSSANRTFNFGQLTTFDIDRVEVLRGPQSGLYGADALGGAIVVYTKQGDGPLKVDALIEGGSFGTINEAVSARGSAGGFNYAFNVGHFRASDVPVTPANILLPGTQRLNSSSDNWTYSTKLGLAVTSDLTLNAAVRYVQSDYAFQGDSFDFGTLTNRPDATRSTQHSERLYTRGEAVWSLFGGRMKNYFGVNFTDLSQTDISPTAGKSFGDGERIKYDWRSVMAFSPGLTVTAGADTQTEKLRVPALKAEEGNSGVYAQVQAEPVRNLFLVGNVRQDDNDSFGKATTWRFAPAYLFEATGTKIKASAGTAFKAPSLSQRFQDFPDFGFFANPNLKPEESTGYDAGFEQALFGGRAQFGATYFYNDITNLIDGTFDPDTFLSSVANIGKARTTGLEAFASADITDDLRLRGDYTYTEAKNQITGKDLLRRPRQKATISAGWKVSAPLLLTGSVTYLGESFDVDRVTFDTIRQPGFTLVNVAADYKLNDNMSLFGRIDNVFDRRYQSPNGFEGTGIGAYAGVRFHN
jgi:vitamin B12 transporter